MIRSGSGDGPGAVTMPNDGYPPVATEGVWALVQPDGNYQLDNIPFFVREATLGDTISVVNEEGRLWFSKLIARSTNSLLHVVLFEPARIDELCENLTRLGCEVERNEACKLVAINVPQSTPLTPIQEYLQAESSEGWLDHEEPILRHER
jgi:hypothetical protein